MIYPDKKSDPATADQQQAVERVMENVALVLAFASVFVFLIKILFL